MQVTDTGIDWTELLRGTITALGGFYLTIFGVVLILGWVAYGMKVETDG